MSKAKAKRVVGLALYTDEPDKFLRIIMPCGNKWELALGEKIPKESIPCPCGNPDHWLYEVKIIK
jgi:hypothetical protein